MNQEDKWGDLATRMQNEWRNTSTSLWAALLTINGFVIAVFPVLGTDNPKHRESRIFLIVVLMGFAFPASFLLIKRFKKLRELVFKTLKMANEEHKGNKHSLDDLLNLQDAHIKFFDENRSNENIILKLLLVETSIVFLLYIVSLVP
ncbi:MAG: hypothetical protein HY033_04825 [Ignavibacteriae bacterium]|nr:hypothetical protein [Ignavibacteria bacterium]MBI3364213.1 hypothetical protein [Ignavibacteriota bacterium]